VGTVSPDIGYVLSSAEILRKMNTGLSLKVLFCSRALQGSTRYGSAEVDGRNAAIVIARKFIKNEDVKCKVCRSVGKPSPFDAVSSGNPKPHIKVHPQRKLRTVI
jgi:hypothetical protein